MNGKFLLEIFFSTYNFYLLFDMLVNDLLLDELFIL